MREVEVPAHPLYEYTYQIVEMLETVPESDEKERARVRLQEGLFWADKAIERHSKNTETTEVK